MGTATRGQKLEMRRRPWTEDGRKTGIDQFQKGSGRWVSTSCPACSRSVRIFFVPEDTKMLRAGWHIEKTEEHTHEPKPRLKVSAGLSTEKPNGIHPTWAPWPRPPWVDYALNLNASPSRIINRRGYNPPKISLLQRPIKFPIARST